MANSLQIKADVINEFRNKLYFNQLEIERLLNNSSTVSHRELIDTISSLLKENVVTSESINLLEAYFSSPQPQSQQPATIQTTSEYVDEESVGIKKID